MRHFIEEKSLKLINLTFNPKGEVTVIISEINNKEKEDLDESDKKKIKKIIKYKSVKDIVGIFLEKKYFKIKNL